MRTTIHPQEAAEALFKEQKTNAKKLRLKRAKHSKKQRALIAKHGHPSEFALAVFSMVGEISVDEALAAIVKYKLEFSKLA